MEDNIKIREDALKIQEKDIEDTIQSIDNENIKTSFAIAFESLLIVQVIDFIKDKPLIIKILFFAPLLLSIGTAFWNIFSRKVPIHTNVDEAFVRKESYNNWSDYLDKKHLRLNDIYKSAQELLKTKSFLTKSTFGLLSISLLILIIGLFI